MDNTSLRVAKKLSLKFSMQQLKAKVAELKQSFPIEEKLTQRPSVAKYMITQIDLTAEIFWRLFSGGSPDKVWDGIWFLQYMEKIIDEYPEQLYPDGDGDLLFFESYGKGFDILMSGTWTILNSDLTLLENLSIDKEIIEFATLERSEMLAKIPQAKPMPPNWEPDKSLLDKLIFLVSTANTRIKKKGN